MNTKAKALLASSLLGSVLVTTPALADTEAGVQVDNSFSVEYTVGTTTSTDTSSTVSFVVDRKVNLTLTNDDTGNVTFSNGDTNVVTTFTLLNDSNETMDFVVEAANAGSGDDGDMDTTFEYYLETGGVAGFDATDTVLSTSGGESYVDDLAADTSVTIYVLSDHDTASLTADGETANIVLTASGHNDVDANGVRVASAGSLGADLTSDNGNANNLSTVETVFVDVVNAAEGDTTAAEDGAVASVATYELTTATLSLTKTQTIISDPLGTVTAANRKTIPGSVVEYCLAVENTGSAAATSVSFSDTVPAEMTPLSTGFRIGDSSCAASDGSAATITNADADGGDITESGGTWTLSAALASVPATSTRTVRFRATID